MAPLLEQAKMQENENDNESGAGNGRGNHSGGELAGSEFQFTFSQPSVVADACAEANAGRKIANLGREWQQRAALARLEGEGLQAPPMTALNKEERAVRRERFLRKAICILHEQLRRKTQLGESLEKLARAQTLELSLSSKERLQVGGEGEGEETMESLLDNLDDCEKKLLLSETLRDNLRREFGEQKFEFDKAKNEFKEKDKQIKALEKQVDEDSKNLEEQKAALSRNQELLEQARAGHKRANERAEGFKDQRDDALKDASGLLAKYKDLDRSSTKTQIELEKFRLKELFYNDAEADIKYERNRNETLNKELAKLREDINALEFNPDAGEYRKKSNASPQKTLEDELSEASQRPASDAESDSESEVATAGNYDLSSPPVLPEIIERIVTQIVTKDVYIDRKVVIDRPFQIAFHHPIKCWLQVELNFVILFYRFAANLFFIFARFMPRIFGRPTPTIDKSTDQTPPNQESGEATPTNDAQHEPAPTTEPQQPTSDPSSPNAESTSDQQSAGESKDPTSQPTTLDLESLRPKLWAWNTITNPKMMPPARPTIFAFACHMLVYAALLLTYSAYTERRIWLAANNSTRILVNQIHNHPEVFRSGVSKILFFLPEECKHAIDHMLFKTVVVGMNLKINHVRPG